MEKLMLIDGNSIVNRAFYGVPMLTNSEGKHTNAIYGFINILFKLLDEDKPQYLAVAFDLPKPTFRHAKFAEYKGTRKGMPDELRQQIPLLKELLTKMNISQYSLEGYEADDVLGTLSKQAEKLGVDCVLVSGDRDMLQLASDTLKIRIPKTKAGKTEIEDYFAADVIEKMGVTPTQYIDVKALMGDTSDNIPGVPGIGEITAFKIIKEYSTLENAIENAALLKPKKAAENIILYKEQAFLSKDLASIDINAPITLVLPDCEFKNMFSKEVEDMLRQLNFKSLISKLNIETDTTNDSAENNNEGKIFINNKNDIKKAVTTLCLQNSVSYVFLIDESDFLGAAFSYMPDGKSKATIYFEIGGSLTEFDLLTGLKELFESETRKNTFDAKKDLHILKRYGVTLNSLYLDEMICQYLINPLKSGNDYTDIASEYLQKTYTPFPDFLKEGKTRGKRKWLEIPQDERINFISNISETIDDCARHIYNKLTELNLLDLYFNLEYPLIFVLQSMESYGIKVNSEALRTYGDELTKKIDSLSLEIYSDAGEEFNINSPKQLGVILFEKLNLAKGKKNKTGYSTSAEVLEKLAMEHPIVKKILEYRMYIKLKTTYADGLINVMDKTTNRIYTTFNQAVTATGRLSSTEPNLQNIPIRLDLGRELRKVFIPEDDYVFVDADYSQIELRVMAHMSGDETLINAYNTGLDIHRLTAAQVCKVPYDEVTSTQRSNAKAVNFGIIYGLSAFGLSQDLHISVKEAERYISGYFERYPSVKTYLDNTVETAKKTGCVDTVFGRRRPLPELTSSNFMQRSFGERVAMNMPVQGTAADIIKIAMNAIYKKFTEENLKSRMLLTVHDELLVEAHTTEAEKVKEIMKREMINAAALKVPLEVDIHTGKTWFDAK